MERIAIVSAVRTPIGKFLGALAPMSAVELGAAAVEGALARCGVAPTDVEEVYMGQARQLGSGPNPARQVAGRAGCGDGAGATTVPLVPSTTPTTPCSASQRATSWPSLSSARTP